jgi:hypothetical protein
MIKMIAPLPDAYARRGDNLEPGRPLSRTFTSGVDPQIGPVAFDRAFLVDLHAQPADLALGDASHARRLDGSSSHVQTHGG